MPENVAGVEKEFLEGYENVGGVKKKFLQGWENVGGVKKLIYDPIPTHMYWIESGIMKRAELRVSAPVENFQNVGSTTNVGQIAATRDTIFWVHSSGIRSRKIGETKVNEVISGESRIEGIALDSNYLYWSRRSSVGGADFIRRSGHDGSGVITLLANTSTRNTIGSIAVDNLHIYMQVGLVDIYRVAKNGVGGISRPAIGTGYVIIPTSEYIYYNEASRLSRAKKNNLVKESVFRASSGTVQGDLYWLNYINNSSTKILRRTLGTEVDQVLQSRTTNVVNSRLVINRDPLF